MDFRTLQAGQEIDALIAEKVFGWRHLTAEELAIIQTFASQERHWMGEPGAKDCVFMLTPSDGIRWATGWSGRIDGAWPVVEKLRERGYTFSLVAAIKFGETEETSRKGWIAGFTYPTGLTEDDWAETAPLAICRAALRAVTDWRRRDKEID